MFATVVDFGFGFEVLRRTRFGHYAWLRDAGVHLLLLPYRGYDGCGGTPSADGLRADALAAYEASKERVAAG